MTNSRKPDERDRQRGRELTRKRKKAGLTQEKFAAVMSVSSRQYGKYERGETRMSMNFFEAALRVLAAIAEPSGLEEGSLPYQAPPVSVKEALKQALQRVRDDLELCIEMVDQL